MFEGKIFVHTPEPAKPVGTPLTPQNLPAVTARLQSLYDRWGTSIIWSKHFISRISRPEHSSPLTAEHLLHTMAKLLSIRRFQRLLSETAHGGRRSTILVRENGDQLQIPFVLEYVGGSDNIQQLVAQTVLKNYGLITTGYDAENTFDVGMRTPTHDNQEIQALRRAIAKRDSQRIRRMDR